MDTDDTVTYFYDHTGEYLKSCIPALEMRDALETYMSCESESFWKDFNLVISAMQRHSNNMVRASAELHMHKNTLIYRYNKIRTHLSLNPMASVRDNDFMVCLNDYLNAKK